MSTTSTRPRLAQLERRLIESFDQLWDRFVDPSDALYDVDGLRWQQLAGGDGSAAGVASTSAPFADEAGLADIRRQCRLLALHNEFAINGHENRVSYIVGAGHKYRVVARAGLDVPGNVLDAAQTVIDEFTAENRWHQRQQEIVRRRDRDGECFLRFFAGDDGLLRVRFIEPDQVATPRDAANQPGHGLGVVTEPHDVESVVGYYVDGLLVPAEEIQHRKLGVDGNVKRGLPLFHAVRKNLRRAEKLLRNMSMVSEIQSAIALIRKHSQTSAAALEDFVADGADAAVTDPATGRGAHLRRYAPGTILDATAGIDYEFPAAGIDAGRFVTVLQAELRAIAARLVMPEFMLSSDASNANYSSTMVAEGPAVRMFERLQHDMAVDDRAVMRRALRHAAAAGRLPEEALAAVDVQVIPPTLAVRDRLRDAQADWILVKAGAMTAEQMAQRQGVE